MKVMLQVNGREMTFSGVDNIKILEDTSQSETGKNETSNYNTILLDDHPLIQGNWFYVYPKTIDRTLFEKELEGRGNPARNLILEAFEEVKKYPNKYARNFKVRIPKSNTFFNDKEYAEIVEAIGRADEYIADWVELALMWAQRISNGEPWEVLHNYMFNVSKYHRFIIWKNGKFAEVGGSEVITAKYGYPEQYILPVFSYGFGKNIGGVPLIASYEV